jgi:hypothetical protein
VFSQRRLQETSLFLVNEHSVAESAGSIPQCQTAMLAGVLTLVFGVELLV